MRHGFILFVALYVCTCQAQTLEQVLRAADVRTDSLSKSELEKKITSYAENKNGNTYLLGFYEVQGDGLLHLPLRLLRYERASSAITQAAVQRLFATFSDTPGELPDFCAGSVLNICETPGHVLVRTHINPSAGCELVFSEQFQLQASFTGWFVANLRSDQLLLHENEIHFASQHAMTLKIVDMLQRRITEIYPPKTDPLHSNYESQLKSHMPSEQWCRETNSICDPSAFDCDLDGPVAVSPDMGKFAFIALFDPGGFGPDAQHAVPPERVGYIYTWAGGTWHLLRESRAGASQTAEQLLGSL